LVNQITYPSGGYVHYTWTVNSLSEPGYFEEFAPNQNTYCSYQYDVPAVKQRTVSFDGVHVALTQTFAYTTTWNSSNSLLWNSKSTTVTTTDNITGLVSTTSYTYSPLPAPTQVNDLRSFAALIPVEQTVVYENAAGTALRTTGKVWYDPYELYSQQTILSDSTATAKPTSQTTYTYGAGAQITDKQEYDYGAGAPGPLLRNTVTKYQSFAATPIYPSASSIFNKPCQNIVYDGSGNRYSETDYYYDGGTALCPSTAPTQTLSGTGGYTGHDETNYGVSSTAPRGNLTQKTQWGSTGTSPVTTYTYDETGQALSMKDPCGNATCGDMTGTSHTTTYSYADSYSSGTPPGATNAYLTKKTDPLGHIVTFAYGYADGQLTSSTDANNQTTTYKYNTKPAGCSYQDQFDRLTETDYPDGGITTYCYNDTPYNASTPSPSVTTTKSISASLNEVNVAAFDGLGHTVETMLTSDPDGTTYTATSYNGTGKPYQTYNPTRCNPPTTRCNSESTWGVTTNTYDILGRTVSVSEADNSVVSTTYCGNSTLAKDEAGHWRRSISDGLGRLTEADEPNSSTATVTACPQSGDPIIATTYTYTPLNDMTGVLQGGSRPRSFSYDSLSRLISSTNPESNTTPTSNPVSVPTTYGYDPDGNLASKTVPAQNQTGTATVTLSYCYDALSRTTSKAYTSQSCPMSAPVSTYSYDQSACLGQSSCYNVGRRTAMTDGLGSESWSYDKMGRPLADQRVTNSITKTATYSYFLDGSGQCPRIPQRACSDLPDRRRRPPALGDRFHQFD